MISLAFQTDKQIRAYGPLAEAVETHGFDAVSVYNDMLFQPAWLPLAEMARSTSRILVGPSAVNPFTNHPINLAGNIAIIDEISDGRAYLGLVRGAWLKFAGLQPRHAVSVMKEAMQIILHLLRRSNDPFPGNHFTLEGGDSLRWEVPRAEVPILLGSWGPKTIQACAPYFWAVKAGGTASPKAQTWLKNTVHSAVRAAGRSPDDVYVASGAVTVVDEDGEAARARARHEVALYLPVIAQIDPTLDADPELIRRIRAAADRFDFDEAAGMISDDLLRIFAYAGTPQEVSDHALEMFDAGADWVEFGTPHGISDEEGLRLLGTKVLPNLRSQLEGRVRPTGFSHRR